MILRHPPSSPTPSPFQSLKSSQKPTIDYGEPRSCSPFALHNKKIFSPAKTFTVKNGDSTTDQVNTEYTKWVTRDQALLGYIMASLTRDVLMSVATHTTSPRYGVLLQECLGQARMLRLSMKKGATSMTEYYTKMKNLVNEMAASGQALGDEEFVAYVLTGLDKEIYN
jgi:hypothetical protein